MEHTSVYKETVNTNSRSITSQYFTLQRVSLHYCLYISIHYCTVYTFHTLHTGNTLHYNTLYCIALHCIPFHCITLDFTTLHDITVLYSALHTHKTTQHNIALHNTRLASCLWQTYNTSRRDGVPTSSRGWGQRNVSIDRRKLVRH